MRNTIPAGHAAPGPLPTSALPPSAVPAARLARSWRGGRRGGWLAAAVLVAGCGGSSSSSPKVQDPCAAVVCTAADACHLPGTCDPATGACTRPTQPDGHACDDGNGCTVGEACLAGACTGGALVTCTAPDACHAAGACDPALGACQAVQLDGPTCALGGAVGVCRAGACVPVQGLEGTYTVHGLSAGAWSGWSEGTAVVDEAGVLRSFFEAYSDATFSSVAPFEAVRVDAAGRITVASDPGYWGTLSTDRSEAFASYVDRDGSAVLAVYQRQAGGLATADLAGSWDVHALLVDLPPFHEATWYRGRAEVDAAGQTARALLDARGGSWVESYGTSVSADGVVERRPGFDTSRRGGGALSAGGRLLAAAWTPLEGGAVLELAVRVGPAPRLSDLAGDWSFHALASLGPATSRAGVGHGALSVDEAGQLAVVYQVWSEAGLALPEGQLGVDAAGRLTLASRPSFLGRRSVDGELLVATLSLEGGGDVLLVGQRRSLPPARPVLEPAATARATLDDAGGTLTALAADGTRYQLDLPPGALAPGAAVEVAMTPISALPGLPVNGALVGAVQLEPDGLQLLVPGTLTVERPGAPPSQVLGFTYPGRGLDRAGFLPARVPGGVVVDLLHFSGAGVAAGSAAGQDHSDQAFVDQLAVVSRVFPGDQEALRQVMADWLDAIVADVSSAARGGSLERLTRVLATRLGAWVAQLQLLGLGESLCSDQPGRAADLAAVLAAAVPGLITDVEAACKATSDRCGKVAALRKLLDYDVFVQAFASTAPCLGLDETPVCGACGAAGDALPIRPGISCGLEPGLCATLVGTVGQTLQLGASFTGPCGNDVSASSENRLGALARWTSTRPGIASVSTFGGEVTFHDVGEAAIRLGPAGLPCIPPVALRAVGTLTALYEVTVTSMTLEPGGAGCSLVTGPPAPYAAWLEVDSLGFVTFTPSRDPFSEVTIGRAGLPLGVLAFRTEVYNPYVPLGGGSLPYLIEREWRLEGTAGQVLRGAYRWGWGGERTPEGSTGCQGESRVELRPASSAP